MKLKIGFLGVGTMGLSHLQSLHVRHARFAEAVAICARNQAHVRAALAVAPNAKVFSDELALVHSDLDAVVVSTPNFTHVPLALETLRADRHLFLEKPCGITREECRRLLAAANRTDRVVMIGHELRYSPCFRKIKTLVDAGEIGVPRMVWAREFRGPFQKKSQDWIQDDRRSGGSLVDKNCHHFDLMNWWVGARPRRVAALGGCAVHRVRAGKHQVHDHATVSFEYANGALGTLQLCLFAREFPDCHLEMGIIGDQGMLQTRIVTPQRNQSRPRRAADPAGMLEILHWPRGVRQREPIIHKVEAGPGEGWGGHSGFREIHEAFLRAVRHGQRPLTTVGDCVDGTLLAIAAEESIKERRMVELE